MENCPGRQNIPPEQNAGQDLRRLKDSDLVARGQQGESDAIAELLSRHRARCFRTALGVLKNSQDAEDAVQNALLLAYQQLGKFRQEAQFATWVNRIVVNQCLMRLRRNRRMRFLYTDDIDARAESMIAELRDPRRTSEDMLALTQLTAKVMKELNHVPAILRDVIWLQHVEELGASEVAARLGITVAATKSRLSRARQLLRVRLGRHTRPAVRSKQSLSRDPLAGIAKCTVLAGLSDSVSGGGT